MIIVCINCNKKFEVNSVLIPLSGRLIQCGSCNHAWFFKKSDQIVNDNFIPQETNLDISKDIVIPKTTEAIIAAAEINIPQSDVKKDTYDPRSNKLKVSQSDKTINNINIFGNFFSYLLVSIITFVAIIITLDTFKKPLIIIFPKLEIFLFNLYETLKDINLFIIDLM